MDNEEIDFFRKQKRSYDQFGFNQWLEKPIAVEGSALGFISADDANALFQGFSASKSTSGLQTSKSGFLEIDWDEGVLIINFPGGGFLKFGNIGTDFDGNQLYGSILNDGSKNIKFEGFKQGAF